jgi:general secretion pathway protein L
MSVNQPFAARPWAQRVRGAARRGRWAALRDLLLGSTQVIHFDPERKLLLAANGQARSAGPTQGVLQPVELRLPASVALRKSVRLPAAAAENLRNLLALEMDRETPFAAESVWFGYRIASRDRARLLIELVVVPRSLFEECTARLAAHGMAARWIAIEPAAGEAPVRVPVGEDERRWARAASPILLGAVLVLALLTGGLDLMRTQRLEGALATARLQAEQALALQRRLASVSDEAGRGGLPSRAAILAALSDALPDGVWLDRLSIDGATIEIAGFAPDAAALLVGLERSPPLHDAHFLGATVRDPKTQRDHFQISLTVREDKP